MESKAKRTSAKSQFTRSEKKLKEALLDAESLPISLIERRLEDLKIRWNTVQDTHDEYMESNPAEAAKTDEQEAWINEISDRYDNLEVEVHRTLEVQNLKASTIKQEEIPQSAATASNRPQSSVQLDRLKLEKFDGDIRKYPKFREQFDLYIKPLCSTSQVPFVLRSHLSDKVKDEVDNIDDNLDTLWERLDKKYGNHGQLVDAILDDIAKLPRGEGKNTLVMINTIEKAYRDLERMNCESEMKNGTIISMIERKLPADIRSEWLKIIAEKKDTESDEKFSLLMQLLKRSRCIIEYDQAEIRKSTEKKGVTHHTTTKGVKSTTERCWIHDGEGHPIWVCKSFKSMSVPDRISLAQEHKACLACLSTKCTGHTNASNCKKKFTCTVQGCKETHNKLLHL